MKTLAASRPGRWPGALAAVAVALVTLTGGASAQTIGDFRSVATGNWSATSTWETWDGGAWVPPAAAPSSTDGVIEIRSGHTVTIDATVIYDQVVVDAGGQVTVAATVTHTLANGAGTDLIINGTWLNQGGTWTVTGAAWSVGAGGTYIHNTTSGISTPLGAATLDAASTFIYRGSSTLTPAVSTSGRTYGNLTLESTSGSWSTSASGAGTLTINGDFTIGSGVTFSTTQTGTMTFAGNFTNNGTLTNSTGTQVYTFTGSGKSVSGSGAISFETFNVNSGASITLGSPVTIASTFAGTVNSGATLATAAALTVSGSLTVGGTLQLNTGGSVSGVVTYSGTGALVYDHTGSFTIGNEWTTTGAVGAGVPANVTMQGGGTLNFPSGTRGTPGNLTQNTGTLSLGTSTLEVGGNVSVTSTLSAGSANLKFNTGSTATLGCNVGGVSFNAVTVDKGAGSLSMNCDMTANGGLTVSTGTLNVEAHTLNSAGLVVSTGATMQVVSGSTTFTNSIQCDGSYVGGSSTNFLTLGGAPGTWSTTNPAQSFGGVSIAGSVSLGSAVTVYELTVLSTHDINLAGFNLTAQSDVTTQTVSTLTVPSGSTLSVGRNLHLSQTGVYNSGGTLLFTGAQNGAGDWSNSVGTPSYGAVVIASGASITGSSTVRASSLTLNGTFNLQGFSGFQAIVSGNTDLNTGGNITFVGGGILQTGSLRSFGGTLTGSPPGLVRLTGSSGQLGGTSVLSVGDLEIGSGAATTLAGDVSVTNSLTLSGGNVTTGSNTLIMVFPSTVTRTSGGVAGNLRKHFVGGPTPSVTYEMASGATYEPVVVTPANVTTSGEVTLSLAGSLHSQIATSGLAAGRRWGHTVSLSPGAMVVSGTTRFDFTLDPAALEGSAAPGTFIARAYNGGAWSPTTRISASPTAHSAQLTLGSGTTDLALGNQGIDHYLVAASSPQTAGATFSTSVTAQDVLNQTVADDNSTAVTMTSDGAAAYDANADASFGDNVKTLTNGAFNIDSRDNTAQTVALTAADGNSKTGSRTGLVVQAGPASQLAVVQEPGGAVAGAVIAPHFTVRLRDAFGNNVTTSGVSMSVALSSGSGTLLGTTTRNTDANGSVEFDDLSIQAAGANKQLTASSGSLSPAVSANFTISAAAAANLAFDVEPSGAVAGAAISPAVRVKVTDAFSNPIPTELVSLSLVGTGTLSGYAPTNTDASGIATFSTLSVNLVGSKHLDATAGSLSPVSSANFTISAGAAATLAFDVEPTSAMAGAAISPAVRVKVTDAFSNPIPTELVSLSLVGSGTLSGYAPTNTDASGIATFSTLSVNLVGSKHLDASAGSLSPVSSANFTISAGAAATLAFDVQPSNTLVGANISPAVRVIVSDAFSNPIPTELVSLSLVGTGTLSGYAPTNTDANGKATFSTLNINLAGTKRLSATTTSLGPLLSNPFDITCPSISLAPASLPAGTAGTAYSQTVVASGGVSPYGYTVTAGALPGGVGLNGGTGEISGTPAAAGTFNFTVTATDAAGCTGVRAYSLLINVACPSISVLPASLPNGSTAVAYNQTLTASAGTAPFTFAVTAGGVPTGLTFTGGGVLSGTPTATGTFAFTIGVTDVNGCTGSRGYSVQIFAIPTAVTNLAAQQVLSGNDTDGTTKILISFTPPSGTASVEVYRAGFGHYPEYDDAGGSTPATPTYPPGAPWTLTGVTASGQTDETTARDFYYYVVFAKNGAGGVSGVSNKTTGTLNYHLGDVSNGFTVGQGNNGVGDEDISLLGANYGIGEAAITTRGVEYLDVGPTTDLFLTSRPFTDDRIDFEDFIVFASNYNVVSHPPLVARATPAAPAATSGPEEFRVEAPSLVEAGTTVAAALRLKGAGRIQGFSAQLAWDASVVQPLGLTVGNFMTDQNGMVLSPQPGTVDAAILGVRDQGISGEGEVARVTFKVLRAGDAGIRLAQVVARDAANRTIEAGAIHQVTQAAVPTVTALLAPAPNPFRSSATLVFSLSQPGAVELALYSVDGRRVKTLVNERREPGVYRVVWDGRDEGRNAVAPGVFYAHLSAAGKLFTKSLVYLK